MVEGVKCEELENVAIGDDGEKFFQVGAQLPPREKEERVVFLRENIDVFAWSAYEALGVDPNFIFHHLNVNPAVIPRKQPHRRSSKEHSDAIKDEVIKLKQAGAIKEVFYPGTLVVKKNNGKWLVCVDFTYLNKACPMDPFPMPRIDQLVDATVGHPRMSFLDAFQGVGLGKFLGYMVTHRGIEVNPDQIKLKEYLSRPPIMSKLEKDEVLFAYIVVAPHAVSLVLIRVNDGIQRLVYYVSKSLHEAEVWYLSLENVILAVVHATRKLPHYFQAHIVVVLTQLPLQSLLRRANYTGRIAKWGTILGAFDIKYIKGQVLADLVARFAKPSIVEEEEKQNMDGKSIGVVSLQEPLSWRVYVDGAANQRGSGVGLVMVSLKGIVIEKSLRLGFLATNNEAEYEALSVGMTMVQKMERKALEVFLDFRLVVGQVEGELEAKDPRMQEYLSQVHGRDSFLSNYGVEALIPLETGFPTLRTSSFTPDGNDGLLKKSLDLIEERRENAMVQLAYYQ
ncbi:uncharacterized protein LOC142638898 [Castanea sativa]|uniref:uncharacterized protein LOC142638898 n=1 Tax=Castanea sativa TaxID=21020 RepID=UPI003F651EFD